MSYHVLYTHALPSWVNQEDWGRLIRGIDDHELPRFANTSNALHVVIISISPISIGEWRAYEGVVLSKDWERDMPAMIELISRQGNKLSEKMARRYYNESDIDLCLRGYHYAS